MSDTYALNNRYTPPEAPSWHVERMDAIVRELWRTHNIDLHMCDGSVKTGQSGLLHDIRESWRIIQEHLDLALDTVDMNHAACKTAESSIGAAILFERERCAQIAETESVYPELNVFAGGPEWYQHGKRIARVIRGDPQ